MRKNSKSFILAISTLVCFNLLSLTSCVSIGSIVGEDNAVAKIFNESKSSIESATEEFTPENEYYVGRSVAANIISTYPVDKNNIEMTKYLNKICNAITINSSMPYLYYGYSVAILDTDEINAMATPGGHIFISRGLIQSTKSEDELAAVIAHEISHIQLKHSMSIIYSSRATEAVINTAKAGILVGAAIYSVSQTGSIDGDALEELAEVTDSFSDSTSQVFKTLVQSGFSKEQEFEADSRALTLLSDAGYDPYCMIDMLKQIDGEKGNYGWGATHPKPKERIDNVKSSLEFIELNNTDFEYGKKIRQSRFNQAMKNFK